MTNIIKYPSCSFVLKTSKQGSSIISYKMIGYIQSRKITFNLNDGASFFHTIYHSSNFACIDITVKVGC